MATTRGSSVKRELIAHIDYQIGHEGKVQKVVLKIERTPIPNKEQDAWKMQAEVGCATQGYLYANYSSKPCCPQPR